MFHKVYDYVTVDNVKKAFLFAENNCLHSHIDVLNCKKSFHRQNTKLSLNDVIDYFEKSNQMKDYSRSRKYLYERTIKYLKIYFKNICYKK